MNENIVSLEEEKENEIKKLEEEEKIKKFEKIKEQESNILDIRSQPLRLFFINEFI